MPTTRFFKDVLDKGLLGRIYHCYIKCIKESGLWEGRRLEWRFDGERAGSGVLGDLGSHMIDFLNWANEDIVGLSANTGIFIKERQKEDSDEWAEVTTDDYANILADLKSGATANIELSRCAQTEAQLVEFVIYGQNGCIKFSNAAEDGLDVCFIESDEFGNEKQIIKTPESYGKMGGIFQSESFVNMTEGKCDNYTTTIDNGLKAQIVIDAALKSAKEKRYVTVAEIENELK